MRTTARFLAGLAVATLLVGIGWAFVSRNSNDSTTPALLLVIGVVAAVDATAFLVLAERDPDGLRVGAARLPAPMWWPPLLAAGLVGLVGGLWISVPVAMLGGVVLLAAGVGAVRQLLDSPHEPGPTDRRTVRAARQILGFGHRHTASDHSLVSTVVEPIGQGRVRLVLVAADGTLGDLVVSDEATARAAAALARADVEDAFSRELGARIRTGPYEWVRMAGSQLGGSRL
jgi:hypothetical protein